MLPVSHMLAFGECQRLWGLPEGDRRCPDTPQRCHTAASLTGVWLVAQSEATPSEYLDEVDGEVGHISGLTHLPQPWNKTHPCVETGPGVSSLSVWQHLSPCAGALTISIFLKPPGVIPPGGSTTICCICQCSYGSFVLYKGSHRLHTLEQSGSRAEFSISNATYKDRGTYNCHYLEGGTVLARSDELDVLVEGEGCAVTLLVGSPRPRAHQDACDHFHNGQGFSLLGWYGEMGTIFTSA